MRIYAPVKDFNGLRNGVRFVDGIGETDNPKLIEWFRTHGYKVPIENAVVEPVVEPTVPIVDDTEFVEINKLADEVEEPSGEPDFESMTPNELREWAKANGLGLQLRNIRSKEKLLELIRG